MKRALCVLLSTLLACSERHAPSATPRLAISAAAVHSGKPAPGAAPLPEAASTCRAPTPQKAGKFTLEEAPKPSAELAKRPGAWLADEHYAQLSAAPEASWADGPASYAGQNTALRNVAMNRIPKPLRVWLGRAVRVLGASGAVCETRLQRFAIRAQVTPDPARAEVWDGCAEPPLPPAEIADEIWRLSRTSGRTLVAEFATPCRGALLAVDPDLPTPVVAAAEPASAEVGERALRELRKLPAYGDLQTRFLAATPEASGAWEDHDGRRSVWSLTLPGSVPLVFVSVEAGAVCSAFSGSLSALWEDGANGLALLATPQALDGRRLAPSAIIDLQAFGGGVSILLGPDGRFAARARLTSSSRESKSFAYGLLSSVPFFFGPC